MKALILAAGYGTRMYPLTKDCPKPLLAVGGRPILDYTLEKLGRAKGLKEAIIVTNDKFFKNFRDWAAKAGDKRSFSLKVLNDGTKSEGGRLGAIGDINFALSRGGVLDDLLIFGGDNLFEEGLSAFLKFALKMSPAVSIGVYDVREKEQAKRYGVVELGPGNKIISFSEKPKAPKSTLAATCLYYIPKEKLGYFKEYARDSSNEQDTSGSFIKWLVKKEEAGAFIFKKRWFDIGDPRIYQEADKVFGSINKESKKRWRRKGFCSLRSR